MPQRFSITIMATWCTGSQHHYACQYILAYHVLHMFKYSIHIPVYLFHILSICQYMFCICLCILCTYQCIFSICQYFLSICQYMPVYPQHNMSVYASISSAYVSICQYMFVYSIHIPVLELLSRKQIGSLRMRLLLSHINYLYQNNSSVIRTQSHTQDVKKLLA